jgi:DNA-binding transcriptional ArsR family regulator
LNGLSAGEIAHHFHTTRPAVSQHLTVLRNAGLLIERREGRTRIYKTNPETIDGVVQHLQSFWSGRLAELKRLSEIEERHHDRG